MAIVKDDKYLWTLEQTIIEIAWYYQWSIDRDNDKYGFLDHNSFDDMDMIINLAEKFIKNTENVDWDVYDWEGAVERYARQEFDKIKED